MTSPPPRVDRKPGAPAPKGVRAVASLVAPVMCGIVAGVAFGLSEDRPTAAVAVLFAVLAVLLGLAAPPAPPIDPTGPGAHRRSHEDEAGRTDEPDLPSSAADRREPPPPERLTPPSETGDEVLERGEVTWTALRGIPDAEHEVPPALARPVAQGQYAPTRSCGECGATTTAGEVCARCGHMAAPPVRWAPTSAYAPFPRES